MRLKHLDRASSLHAESEAHIALTSGAIHFRNMADIIADDFARVAQAAMDSEIQTGTLKRTVLSECYESVQRAVELAIEAVPRPNACTEDEMEIISGQVKKLAEALMSQVASGLESRDPKSLTNVRLQTIFVDGLSQISSLARRIVHGATRRSAIDNSEEEIPASPPARA